MMEVVPRTKCKIARHFSYPGRYFFRFTGLFRVFIGRMPYVEATILEVLRYKTVFPFPVHSTLHDTNVGGYFVPRGTSVCHFVN